MQQSLVIPVRTRERGVYHREDPFDPARRIFEVWSHDGRCLMTATVDRSAATSVGPALSDWLAVVEAGQRPQLRLVRGEG